MIYSSFENMYLIGYIPKKSSAHVTGKYLIQYQLSLFHLKNVLYGFLMMLVMYKYFSLTVRV